MTAGFPKSWSIYTIFRCAFPKDGVYIFGGKKVMKSLLNKLKQHDLYTYMHSLRVAELSVEISKYLGLSDKEQKVIHLGGLLHDIGKLEVDPQILNKPEKLTFDEWTLIQNHTVIGYTMLQNYGYEMGFSYIALFHHERCDGSGYPFGLKQEAIPLEAQIVALADSFDAMVTQRPYSNAKTTEQALNELIMEKGVLFLPKIVDSLVECKKDHILKDDERR
jgi:putative nucleotidyltransferase with HDIG domain